MTQFTFPVRVYYEDTDAGGVVYHANYLRFMERARTEWLRERGFEQDALRARLGVLFVVHRVKADFLKPARFNDQLEVSVEVTRRGQASIEFRQAVSRGSELICDGQVRVVCVDATSFTPQALPPEVAERI